jgi:hypothetical protein
MTIKTAFMRSTFFSIALLFIFQVSLFAQIPSSFTGTQLAVTGVDHAVHQLEQQIFLFMIGVVLLLGLAWLGYVCSACGQLSAKNRPIKRNALNILFVAASLGIFCSRCSMEQQMRATEINTARNAENPYCICPSRHNESQYFNTSINSTYYNNGYANWRDNPCCRQCGRRIFKR